jgi:hypothetical protein
MVMAITHGYTRIRLAIIGWAEVQRMCLAFPSFRSRRQAAAPSNFVGRVTKLRGAIDLVSRKTALRLLITVALGLAFAWYADAFRVTHDLPPSDFQQPQLAAALLLTGENPYAAIGPDRPVAHQFRLIYPATAAVVAMPFTALPPRAADALFVGLGVAFLAWALTRHTLRNPQLLVFASFAMATAAQTVQWSPYLTAATMLPWLGVLYACKPSVGLAYLIAYPSVWSALGAGALALATVILWPWWPGEWLAAVGTVTHMSAPVTRPGGFLLLLALLRWRRPEARLLAALACIPQTPVLYEAVPLFLIVSTLKEGLLLAVLTAASGRIVNALGADLDYNAWMMLSGQWMLWMVYLPCLAFILRRANVAVPATRSLPAAQTPPRFAAWAIPFRSPF